MSDPQGDTDFFISYRGEHTDWARWVNWVLRSAGFSTVLMDEFPVGTTWTNNIRDAAQNCRRLIPLYSQDYWQSGACIGEFDAFWTQHLKNAPARFLLPLKIQPCTVPAIHSALLSKSIHSLTRDGARAVILHLLEGLIPIKTSPFSEPEPPFSEPEPPFPGLAPIGPVADWPDSVDSLKWPLADHDHARNAFTELVTRGASFRFLAIKGGSETGKSHLTEQFFTNARRRVTACRCARFDFKGITRLEDALATFVQHLEVPLPPATSSLSDRFRAILHSLVQLRRPTLLIFDTYEHVGEADRWVRESLLTSLHSAPWLRVVIAGQDVPPCHGNAWAEDGRLLRLEAPEPDHWMEYAKASGRTITLRTLAEVHREVGGKASVLALLCSPRT